MIVIEDLPEEWNIIELGKLVEIQTGYPFPSENFTEKSLHEAIPLIRIRDLQVGIAETFISGSISYNIQKNFLIQKGDILIGMDGNFYIVNWPGKPGLLNQRIARLRKFSQNSFDKFIFYACITPLKGIEKAKHFTTVKHLSMKDLKTLIIPFPPLAEQKKIAGVLRAVQEAKERTEEVIKATKELKKSLMKHLFTYGPVPIEEADKVELKETEIGKMPEGWNKSIIDEIVEKTNQRDPKKTPLSHFKYIDVSSIEREYLKIAEYKSYQGKDAPSRAKKIVEKDDVIFATVRPTLKRLSIIKEGFSGEICSTAFCVLRVKKDIINPRYLFYTIQRDIFVEELGKIQRGASYPAVTDSDVKGQKIPLPPLYAQQKISDILTAIDKKIEAEENKKKALEELFKTLLNNLMTGKIRAHNLDIEV